MSSNYPPGVTESMIPGFRPQDEEAERYVDSLGDDEILDWIYDKGLDARGCVIYVDDDGEPDRRGVRLESDAEPDLPDWPRRIVTAKDGRSWSVLFFDTEEDAVAYALCFHESELVEQMVTEHLEEGPPEQDYDPF